MTTPINNNQSIINNHTIISPSATSNQVYTRIEKEPGAYGTIKKTTINGDFEKLTNKTDQVRQPLFAQEGLNVPSSLHPIASLNFNSLTEEQFLERGRNIEGDILKPIKNLEEFLDGIKKGTAVLHSGGVIGFLNEAQREKFKGHTFFDENGNKIEHFYVLTPSQLQTLLNRIDILIRMDQKTTEKTASSLLTKTNINKTPAKRSETAVTTHPSDPTKFYVPIGNKHHWLKEIRDIVEYINKEVQEQKETLEKMVQVALKRFLKNKQEDLKEENLEFKNYKEQINKEIIGKAL